MIHFKADWTPEEAQALEGMEPGREFFVVLGQNGATLEVVGFYPDLESARAKRRQYQPGRVLTGRLEVVDATDSLRNALHLY